MSDSGSGFYDVHVFCCLNERAPGHPRGCCLHKGAGPLRDYMKKRGKALKIPKLRVNTAGCLDRCELGPVLVIYPEGDWYHYETEADVDEILETRILKGEAVPRLQLTRQQTELRPEQVTETVDD